MKKKVVGREIRVRNNKITIFLITTNNNQEQKTGQTKKTSQTKTFYFYEYK
jgi:hypothetical protein